MSTQANSDGVMQGQPRKAWKPVRLGDVVAEARSGFATGQRDPAGVIQLRMNNVNTTGEISWDQYIRVPTNSEMLAIYELKPGDIVFNNTNSVELVGKSALFRGHAEPVVFSNHFTRLRTVSTLLLPEFLTIWLIDQWTKGTFAEICNKWIGQAAVKPDKLLSRQLLLPPMGEQLRICKVMDKGMAVAMRARTAAEEQLRAVRAIPAALMRRALSGEL